jgi:RNA polymerase sigma-70 factor, ECF subfamily
MRAAPTDVAIAGPISRRSATPILSDEVLVARVASGDAAAMRALFARHQVRVYRFVRRIVNDPTTAEDLTSEVFLDVWRRAPSFKARSTVTTWLLAIARYKSLSLRRRPQLQQLDAEVAARIVDTGSDPAALVEQQDRKAVLRRCLALLSTEHRQVIDLVYYHERSIREVAEIVGIPANTAKTRVFFARKRLAELLAASGVDCATA